MPDIAALVRNEILRLARRVSRQTAAKLRKDIVSLKRKVTELTRIAAELRRDNTKLLMDYKERMAVPVVASAKELEHAHLGPSLIRAQRARLGLSREVFGKLIGASAGAVLAWEGGRSKPRDKARAALIAVRKLGKREAQWRLEARAAPGR
jgi:DNA-binding transcriptional regulator YiaG